MNLSTVGFLARLKVGSCYFCGAGIAFEREPKTAGDLSKSEFRQSGHTHNRFGRAIAISEQHQDFRSFTPKFRSGKFQT